MHVRICPSLKTSVQTAIGASLLAGVMGLLASSALAQAPAVSWVDAQATERAAPGQPFVPRSVGLAGAFGAENRVQTPALDVERLLFEDEQDAENAGKVRMGLVQDFDAVRTEHDGRWTMLPDGGWLWTMAFEATSARCVRLRVSHWNPPDGAELLLYTDADDELFILEPVARRWPAEDPADYLYWSKFIPSSTVKVEYYLPPDLNPLEPNVHITIDGILNGYRSPFEGGAAEGAGAGLPACFLDVSCYPAYQANADGVGALASVDNTTGYFCTGGMLNRIGSDLTPLFMTAFHCVESVANGSSLVVTWFYQSNSCNGSIPNPSTLQQQQGTTFLLKHNPTDWALVGMEFSNWGGVTFLGWNAGSWGFGIAYGINHPAGSWKRIYFGLHQGSGGNCVQGANNAWQVDIPEGNGRVRPGASGSPVFDGNGLVRGTYSCQNLWDQCDETQRVTYGQLNQVFPHVAAWLDPVNPVYVNNQYSGLERGTPSQPLTTVIKGVYAVTSSSNVFINSGTYNQAGIQISKPMTLNSLGGNVVIH